MKQFEVATLDVWGNSKEGFLINDVFRHATTITVSDDASDVEIIKALISVGMLKPSMSRAKFFIDGDTDHTLCVERANLYGPDAGRPLFNLYRI